jgi:hypothetical protein
MTGTIGAHVAYVRGLKKISEQARESANLVAHPSEKGRILEGIAKALLEQFLPKRYSIGTGIVITSDGRTSKQTDLVIYDNQRNAPLMFQNEVGLFPIECVYGTIEIKSVINGTLLGECAQAISIIRNFKDSKSYYFYKQRLRANGQPSLVPVRFTHSLAPKSFILAFDTEYRSIDTLREAFQSAVSAHSTHIHGIVILKNGWFVRQAPFKSAFDAAERDGVDHFLAFLLAELESMGDLMAADLSKYFSGIEGMKRYFLELAENDAKRD